MWEHNIGQIQHSSEEIRKEILPLQWKYRQRHEDIYIYFFKILLQYWRNVNLNVGRIF